MPRTRNTHLRQIFPLITGTPYTRHPTVRILEHEMIGTKMALRYDASVEDWIKVA